MAVPNPNKPVIDENQYKYLTNMSTGKTATGGAANVGQQKWATAQLANSSYTPVPNPNPTTPKTTPVNTASIKAPVTTSPVPSPIASMSPVTSQASQYTDWQKKQSEQYANLEKLMNSQFSYDPETDPAYQAQRQLAQLRAGDATKNAMEAANEKGVFGSSLMTNQMGQIQQRAEQEAAAYIPEYRQQAYGQYQDRLANAGNLLNQAGSIRNQNFGEATTEAELTGSYMSPEARSLLNGLFDLKSQAESTSISKEARAALSKQADGIRAQLSGMGVDQSLFGSNVNLNSARGNMGQAGLSTMAKQNQDFNQSTTLRQLDRNEFESDRDYKFAVGQQEWENNFQQGQFDWQKAQQAWENTFQEKNFQQQMKEAAASRGLQWANLAQNQKEFVANQAFREKEFSYKQSQDKIANSLSAKKGSGSSTISAKESANNMNEAKSYISKLSEEDAVAYIQGISDYLNDSDYRALLNSIQY